MIACSSAPYCPIRRFNLETNRRTLNTARFLSASRHAVQPLAEHPLVDFRDRVPAVGRVCQHVEQLPQPRLCRRRPSGQVTGLGLVAQPNPLREPPDHAGIVTRLPAANRARCPCSSSHRAGGRRRPCSRPASSGLRSAGRERPGRAGPRVFCSYGFLRQIPRENVTKSRPNV